MVVGGKMIKFIIRIYNFFRKVIRIVDKTRKRYTLAVKIQNILIKTLNLAATGYSLFVTAEPFIKKIRSES